MKATIALLLSLLISFPAFAADSREDLILELVDEVTPSSSKHRLAGETIHRQDSPKPKAR